MIVIGRLHIGDVLPEWLIAWEELRKPTTPEGTPDWITYSAMRQVVHCARNDIVRDTLRDHPDATHLFFIDDDICVPPDGLLTLVRDSIAHDIPVVSGLYIQRGVPHLPVVYRRLTDGHHVQITRFCAGLQEVDAVGAGCLLIRTDVLRAIETTGELWFDWPVPPQSPTAMSEDLAFCARAKALGYRIALDADVQCGHLSIISVTYEHFAAQVAAGKVGYGTAELAAASQEVRPWQSAAASQADPDPLPVVAQQ